MIRSARIVRKRDGREVPFEQGKVVEAIWRAARAVGGGDRLLAEELGSVVSLFIERDYVDRTPSIEDVSDLIEKVLVETGHARTAKAFILERERRARIRQALRVRDDIPPARGPGRGIALPAVDAHSRAGVSTWSKAKIVEALVIEADVPENVAAEIASEVERRVFASGITRISTSLIRALVDNELFERGYDGLIHRQAVLGLPRYDLDRMARSGVEHAGASPAFGPLLDLEVARSTWSQYSLREIFPADVAEAHSTGRLHLGGLATPTRFEEVTLDAPRLRDAGLPGEHVVAGDPCAFVDSLRLLVARASSFAGDAVVIRGVADLMHAALQSGAAARTIAQRLLIALAAPAGADLPVCRVEIALPLRKPSRPDVTGLAHAALLHELVSERGRIARALRAPWLAFDLEGAREAPADLLAAIALVEGDGVLVRGGSIPLAPPAVMPLLGRVHVNVAHAALRVGRNEPALAIEYTVDAVKVAVRGCVARADYFASLVGAAGPFERARVACGKERVGAGDFEIALAGLDAAARLQTGQSLLRETGRDFAVSVVAAARKALAAEAATHRIAATLAISDQAAVFARFGKIDAERFPRGRDTAMLPHDGVRYVYSGTLPALPGPPGESGDEPVMAAAAADAALRRALAASALTGPFTAVEDRVTFLKSIDPLLREDQLRCA